MIDDYEDHIFQGHCLDILKQLPDESFHAVVTDPPYGLGPKEPTVKQLVAFLKGANLDTGGDFMGADWEIPSVLVWKQVFRVLKPGGHVLSFGGTRSWDLISLGLRAAGFEYRDTIADDHPALQWKHGQGFPKSLNVSKALDKAAGAEREVIGTYRVSGNALTPTSEKGGTYVTGAPNSPAGDLEVTAPATAEAKMWSGYGTALKPSWEPILVFRKPLIGKVIDNVLEHGTGALNIDATRVRGEPWKWGTQTDIRGGGFGSKRPSDGHVLAKNIESHPSGRWPPNAAMTHAEGCKKVGTKKVAASRSGSLDRPGDKEYGQLEPNADYKTPTSYQYPEDGLETVEAWECVEGCPVRELDEQSGDLQSGVKLTGQGARRDGNPDWRFAEGATCYADAGGASRFHPQFEGQEPVEVPFFYAAKPGKKETTLDGQIENKHPTKKPVELMKWLIRLVCFKGAKVLDPYCGSGSTLHAACEERVLYTGIERDGNAFATAQARMEIVSGRAEDLQNERSAYDIAMGLDDDDS